MDLDGEADVALADARIRLSHTADCLPDVLRRNLDVVFVGTAAGAVSKELGIYYANAGNRFWSALKQAELVPSRFVREEFRRLPDLGIGLTDLSKTASGMDRAIVVTESDLDDFANKMRACRPRAIAFTSKKAASLWLRRSTRHISYGQQQRRESDPCEVFVLTSPSAVARRWWRIEPWYQLADWLRATKPWRF